MERPNNFTSSLSVVVPPGGARTSTSPNRTMTNGSIMSNSLNINRYYPPSHKPTEINGNLNEFVQQQQSQNHHQHQQQNQQVHQHQNPNQNHSKKISHSKEEKTLPIQQKTEPTMPKPHHKIKTSTNDGFNSWSEVAEKKSNKKIEKSQKRTPPESETQDPQKQIRKLKKKLKQIEDLKTKKQAGLELNPDQLKKLKQEQKVRDDLSFLTSLMMKN